MWRSRASLLAGRPSLLARRPPLLAPVAQHRTFMRAGLNRSVTRQQVVLYPRSTIFAAVSQVELYQDFLPWCMSSRILDRQPSSYKGTPDSAESFAAEVLQTEIGVGYKLLRSKFSSTVTVVQQGEKWRVDAISAPNEYLDNLSFSWMFSEIGTRSTRLDLELAFTLRSAEHCLMWDFAQDAIMSEYLACFQRRCAELKSSPAAQNQPQTVRRPGS
jgi:coenzyme Q-binding protein COQ10